MPAPIKFTMSADDAKILASIQRQVNEYKKLTTEAKESSKQQKGMAAHLKLGADEVLKMGAGFAGMQGVVQGIQTLMAKVAEDAERAANAASTVGGSTRGFLQIAGDDPQLLQRLEREQQNIVQTEGIGAQEAADIVFLAQSTGQLENVGSFAATARFGGSPTGFLESQTTIDANFGAVDPQVSIGKQVTAARQGSLAVSQIRAGIVNAGAAFAAIGGNFDELLALITTVQRTAGTTERAGTQIAALSRKIAELGLGGQGIVAVIPEIALAIRQSGDTGIELLGSEAFPAYKSIADNIGFAGDVLGEVQQSGAGAFQQAIGAETPAQVAERRSRGAESFGRVVGADPASLNARARATELSNRDLQRGDLLTDRIARDVVRSTTANLTGSETATELAGDFTPDSIDAATGALLGPGAALVFWLRRIADNTEQPPLGNGNGEPD